MNSGNQTPLHVAAAVGFLPGVTRLLELGADVDVQDDMERAPLHWACLHGHTDVATMLLTCQANFNSCDSKGASPLHLAIQGGQWGCVQLLVSKGASPDGEDDRKKTGFHFGVPFPDLLEYFVDECGATVHLDAEDDAGRTPLIDATIGRHDQSARYLVIKGADLQHKDRQGKTALDYADEYMRKVLKDAEEERRRMNDVKLQKHYVKVVQAFNKKPKEGVKLLLATKQLEATTPADVARFLHNARGLNKVKVGELLGERDEYNMEILEEFVKYLDFAGLEFDAALRLFLSKFILPGEAQKIDRIMERLANRFCRDNPNIFPHEDMAYMLGFRFEFVFFSFFHFNKLIFFFFFFF